MTSKEQAIYDAFIKRLNGETVEGKPPFKEFVNAAKSLAKLQVSQKVKDELRSIAETKFGRGGAAAPPKKNKKGAEPEEPTLSQVVETAELPKPVPPSRMPVYNTIPEGAAAKLEFLRQAIDNNVRVIHGLMEAKAADPSADVSEIQDAINKLTLFNQQHNDEVDLILKTVFPSGGRPLLPQNGGRLHLTQSEPATPNGTTAAPVMAPTPPTPPSPSPTLGRSPFAPKNVVVTGFQPPDRIQHAPDPKEVELLKRTAPITYGKR